MPRVAIKLGLNLYCIARIARTAESLAIPSQSLIFFAVSIISNATVEELKKYCLRYFYYVGKVVL